MNKKQRISLVGLLASVLVFLAGFFSIGNIGEVNTATKIIAPFFLLSIPAGFVFAILLIIFSIRKGKNPPSTQTEARNKGSVFFVIFIGFGFALIAAIYVFFGPFLLVSSAKDTVFYLSERRNTTQIQATITDINESLDSENISEYDIYVSYKYDNHVYKNVYWRTAGGKNDYSLGEVVDVKIFCAKPDDIVDLGIANYIGWVFPLVITFLPLLYFAQHPPKFLLSKKTKT